jgi:hypothetical protein
MRCVESLDHPLLGLDGKRSLQSRFQLIRQMWGCATQESQMFSVTLTPDADEVVQPHLQTNLQRRLLIEGQ